MGLPLRAEVPWRGNSGDPGGGPASRRMRGRACEGEPCMSPRVLLMRPCSASTAVQTLARKMLTLHGFVVATFPFEPLHQESKSFIGMHMGVGRLRQRRANATRTTALMLDRLAQDRKQGLAVAFKASPVDRNIQVLRLIIQANVSLSVVPVIRRNTIDQLVCQVRDCFDTDIGHPVTSDGRWSSACFKERRYQNIKTMAHVNVQRFVAKLQWWHRKDVSLFGLARQLGCSAGSGLIVASEDLMAYSRSETATDLARSVESWASFLRWWCVVPNVSKIRHHLASARALFRSEGSHAAVIRNAWELKSALRDHPFFAKMFRS
mmetsp:Transcript_3635/g.9259  ORF Transcript_3635/g.9259 Transcript_3635/m.9259 type:complete len:321 (+) Transcript_3635:101-1063(+)